MSAETDTGTHETTSAVRATDEAPTNGAPADLVGAGPAPPGAQPAPAAPAPADSRPDPARPAPAEPQRDPDPPRDEETAPAVDLARMAWLATVLGLLVAVAVLILQGYFGYAGVTFAVAVSAAINLL